MKKIASFFLLATVLFLSCEGPEGPPGQDGFVGQSFERTLNLLPTNNFQQTVEIPLSIELFETDMVLVYRFLGQVDGYDVWKLLPETVYTNSGEFQYGFEHNFDYVTIFMDFSSGFNFNDLFPSDNQNQIFRIVVLPVDFVNSSNIDINNYNQVMEFVQ